MKLFAEDNGVISCPNQLQVRHSTALAVSNRLLPALKIAGLVEPRHL